MAKVNRIFLEIAGEYEVGSLPPDGYIAWHDWAEKQWKSGLRQTQCQGCGRWGFPQEFRGEGKHADRRCLAAMRKEGK